MNNEKAVEVMNAVHEKGANQVCSRCGNREFLMLGEAALGMRTLVGQVGPQELPIAILGCRNCGWISMHSIPIVLRKQMESVPLDAPAVGAP